MIPVDDGAACSPELLEYVDLLLPNEGEACRMTSKKTLDEALEELGAARSLHRRKVRIARLGRSCGRKNIYRRPAFL